MTTRLALPLRVLATVVSFTILYFVVDLSTVFDLVKHSNIVLLSCAVVLLVLRIPLMSLRWQIILRLIGVGLDLWTLTRIVLVSNFFGLVLPTANGSDLARGMLLKRPEISLGKVATSIVIDRLYGLFSTAIMALPACAVMAWLHPDSWVIRIAALFSLLLLIVVGGSFALPHVVQTCFQRGAGRVGIWGRLMRTSRAASEALDFRAALGCVILSLASQAIAIVSIAVSAAAVHLNEPLYTYFAFVPIVWIITMIPITLSGMGLREAGFAVLFQALGAPNVHGVAIGVAASVTGILACAAGGLVLLTGLSRSATWITRQRRIDGEY